MQSDESDGNVAGRVCRRWSGVSHGKLATLLFLLDNGDKTTGGTERCQDINTAGVTVARDALKAVLCHPRHSFRPVVEELQRRYSTLLNYKFFRLQPGTIAANMDVRKEDEALLTMMQACHSLGVSCQDLYQKATNVQVKLGLTNLEIDSSFFIYAENIRLSRLCAALTPEQVVHMVSSAGKVAEAGLHIKPERLTATDGLKEVLFFYLIRQLELSNQLNRIYTDRLEVLLKNVGMKDWVISLSQYPAECRPTGHCVVFCVRTDRSGSDGEIAKVRQVFGHCLGYTLTIEEDPTQDTLRDTLIRLQRPKYRFYDCLVLWFMAHGTHETLKLADGTYFPRQLIIDSFSRLDNFRKKPKIFFMASCQGRNTISIRQKRGIPVAVDGMSEGFTGFSVLPERCRNITAVSYQMDRLVASATLPHHYAFRLKDGGSVYVDTVCRLLEEHSGHNLTLVLERVCNKMHQILFSCSEKFEGEAKQACYYETTFQKTFIVPAHVKNCSKSENLPIST